jgi:hypothetical protein
MREAPKMVWTIPVQPLHKVWLIPDTSISKLFERYMVWTISVLLKSIFSDHDKTINIWYSTCQPLVLSLILSVSKMSTTNTVQDLRFKTYI